MNKAVKLCCRNYLDCKRGREMIRQQAFIGSKKMLKGGLHSHTTRSDGKCTPEEVIQYHYENGYDFLAITDHRKYNYSDFSAGVPITIIPGMEFDNTFDMGNGRRCFHTICIGTAKEDGNGFEQDEYLESGTAKNQEEYQAYLDDFHAKGNLTIYGHPEWSCTPTCLFDKLQGDFAMEIWNTHNVIVNDMDRDAYCWDEILEQGKVVYGVATDDGHRIHHHCKGWVMVQAENNIVSILNALKSGQFYSSCGPEIYDFYVKDGVAVIECSPAARVRLHSAKHATRMQKSEDYSLTRAEFALPSEGVGMYKYIRATVIDKDGRYAWTNPIFLD